MKYLSLKLDRRLTRAPIIKNKCKPVTLRTKRLYHLLARSKLNLNNMLNVYKLLTEPVWSYGVQIRGSANNQTYEIAYKQFNRTFYQLDLPFYTRNDIRHEVIESAKTADKKLPY